MSFYTGVARANDPEASAGPAVFAAAEIETAEQTDRAFTAETPRAQFALVQTQDVATLVIKGAISRGGPDGQAYVDMATLKTLEPHSISTSTVVTDGVLKFDGVLMRTVLDHVGAYGTTVTATALNGYEVDIPIRDFVDFEVLLAWAVNGEILKADDKGPFWIIYPRDQHEVLQDIRYDYRWVWQLNALRVN